MDIILRGVLILMLFVSNVHSIKGTVEDCTYLKVKHLDCSGRNLTSIPEKFPYDVQIIDLSRNNIKEIHSYTFVNLTELTRIVLSSNFISKIRNMSFSSLPKLEVLFLDHNLLKHDSVEVMAFDLLTSLIELYIDSNKFYHNFLPNYALNQMPNIRRFAFDVIDEFRVRDIYRKLPYLDYIDLYLARSGYFLRNATFSGNNSAQIRILIIRLTRIDYGAFCDLKGIKELKLFLYLSANIIDDIFKSLHCLENQSLDLLQISENAHLFTLEENCFRVLSRMRIKRLILNRNSISRIDVASFKMFAERVRYLEEIDLSENPIALDNFAWFYSISLFTNLKTLRFSHVGHGKKLSYSCVLPNCESSDEVTIVMPQTLQELRFTFAESHWYVSSLRVLGGINLQTLDVSYVTMCLCDIVLYGLKNLRFLDTSGMNFLSVGDKLLGSLPNLEIFKSDKSFLGYGLKNNENIINFFKNCTQLQYISLHDNELQDLPLVFFDPVLNSLKFLNLSNNSLRKLPLQMQNFNQLETVDLRHNMINTLNFEDRESLSQATNVKVYLSGNPFLCICETLQFLLWQNHGVIADFDDLVCTTESGQYIPVSEFILSITEFEHHCTDKKWIFVGAAAAGIVVIIILSATIYHKYRFTFQYWYLMMQKRIRNNTKPMELLPRHFDAFIAYSHADWVTISPIIELLENENLNIAYHDKTFEVGKYISENIVDTIYNSKKIIFFVTENFLQSSWGSFEIEMARMHAFRNVGQNMLIIAIKENIMIKDLPNALKNIWRRITCIVLPVETDTLKTNLFCERLKASIAK